MADHEHLLEDLSHPLQIAEVNEVLRELQAKAVVLACHKTGAILQTAAQLGLDQADVFGVDPEYAVAGERRIPEPVSEYPIEPALFKIFRLVQFLEELRVEQIQHHPWILASTNLLVECLDMDRDDAEKAYENMQRALETSARDYVNEFIIMGSDIVLTINGEVVHRYTRDSREDDVALDESETGRAIQRELWRRHAQPAFAEWRCAFGIRHGGVTRMCNFVIGVNIPALLERERGRLIQDFFNPRVSGGLQLIELLDRLPGPHNFEIKNAPGHDWQPIPQEYARMIIVDKTLPRKTLSLLLTDPSVSTQVSGEPIHYPALSVDYELVPLALAQLTAVGM